MKRFFPAMFAYLLIALSAITSPIARAQAWTALPGAARDVGVGADGTVWVIGNEPAPGGYAIYRLRADGTGRDQAPGAAERIAVDPKGNAWVVNNAQSLFRWDGRNWIAVNNRPARDVGIGANGAVWVIGNDVEAGGYGIYASGDNGASWKKIPGSAMRIAVDPKGLAWVVNKVGDIFRFDGNQFVKLPGNAQDIGVGADGDVWVTGGGDGIWRWDGANWARKTGAAQQVAVGRGGLAWVVNAANVLYWTQDKSQATTGSIPINAPQGNLNIPPPASPNQATLTLSAPLQLTMVTPKAAPSQLVVTGLTSLPPNAVVSGPQGKSFTPCGSAGQSGCPLKPAAFVSKAVGNCDPGSFFDLGKWSCWTCPSGYDRSAAAVDTDQACQKRDTSVKGGFLPAKYHGPLCPEGSFHDSIRGGECWKCPAGYKRSIAHVESANACIIPAHEEFSKATRHRNTIWPHECWNAGQFHDIWDGGACWSCPSGFNRTANHVNAENACARGVAEQQQPAARNSVAQCGPGEFFDLKIPGQQNSERGGGCWSCPTTTSRTIFPVDGTQACEMAPQLAYQKATKVKSITCGPDELFDPIDGGTCWKCPTGYHRYVYKPINGPQACEVPGIDWQSAPYKQPGLFGLQGAEEVAFALIKDGTVINQMAATVAAEKGKPVNDIRRAIWNEIATTPQTSDVLNVAILSRLAAAATNPAKATEDELRLVKSAQEEIQKFRIFMAQDALDAYEAWEAGKNTRKTYYKQSSLQQLLDRDEVPPDFQQITADTIFGGLAAGGALGTAGMMAMTNATIFKSVFPYATRARWTASQPTQAVKNTLITARAGRGSRQAVNLVSKVGTEAVAGAAKAGGGAMGAFLNAGPQIIIGLAMELLAIVIEQEIDKAQAKPKLQTGLATAKNLKVDFARMLATPAGTAEVENFWTVLTSGTTAPINAQQFRAVAEPKARL